MTAPAFINGMRSALTTYGETVAGHGIDDVRLADAEVVRAAWARGTSAWMLGEMRAENAWRGWPDASAKAADGSIEPGDGVPSILLDNPYAVQFLETQGAELVVGVTDATRNTIRAAVKAGMEEHLTVQQTARVIRSMVPLIQQHVGAVANLVRAQREAGVPGDRVAVLADQYARKLLAYRALNIAITETIRASAAGLQASWAAAEARGLIAPGAMQRWIGGGGSRTCDICSALIGVEVPMGGEFPGGHKRPPSHVSCRCSLGIVLQ